MADAPMSRRARRALEEQAAERAAQENLASGRSEVEGVPSEGVDGRHLSRRDRRRLERLERPMETWTAEEEMIATGQIPVLTPERIAEQERLAREKAEQAAQDAQLASREFRRVSPHEVLQQESAPHDEVPQAVQPDTQWAPVEEVREEPSEPVAQAQEPEAYAEPQWAPASQEEPDEPADPVAAKSDGYTPAFDFGPEPLASVDTDHARTDAVEPPAGEVPALGEAEPDIAESADARAKLFSDLFPPGSPQAVIAGFDPRPRDGVEQSAAPSTAPEPAADQALPVGDDASTREATAAERATAIEEIRRLAEEAMSGIERASHRSEETSRPQDAEESPLPGPAPLPEPPVSDAAWSQPAWSEPTPQEAQPGGEQPAFNRYEEESRAALSEHREGGADAQPEWSWATATPAQESHGQRDGAQQREPYQEPTPSGGLAPHHATFDQVARTASGGVPQVRQPVNPTPASGAFQQVNQPVNPTPASGAFQQVNQPAPQQKAPQNPWESHPLENAPRPETDPNDFTPVAEPVRPDFSALYTGGSQDNPFSPVTGTAPTVPPAGPLPTSGQFPTGAYGGQRPVTGQIPTESIQTGVYRRPDIPQGPGPRDFKWLHLGVIGALMFVLGVFIYNVAFNQ